MTSLRERIGLATAKVLVKEGARVYMTARVTTQVFERSNGDSQ